MKEEHGIKGHLNIFVKDHDSIVTDFGNHDRVVCFQPSYGADFNTTVMYCRVDHKWSLGEPTSEQILQVARKDQDIKGKFKLARIDKYHDNKSTDYYFIKQ